MENNEDQCGGGGKFLLGLVLGGAIGAIAALLYAPRRGEDTRKMIAQKSSEYTEVAKAKTGEVAEAIKTNATQLGERTASAVNDLKAKTADKTSELVSNVRDSAQNLARQGKALVDAKATQIQNAISEGKEAFADTKQHLKKAVEEDGSEPAA
jgi:gas vesicle protein